MHFFIRRSYTDGMDTYIELDVCGMEPPEPLELVLEALSVLQPDQCLRVLIDREPRPLYQILRKNGFVHEAELRPDYLYYILIRHKS